MEVLSIVHCMMLIVVTSVCIMKRASTNALRVLAGVLIAMEFGLIIIVKAFFTTAATKDTMKTIRRSMNIMVVSQVLVRQVSKVMNALITRMATRPASRTVKQV